MYIIAGLGNPGKEYENTRHNIGFDVIDRLAEEENIAVMESKHKALKNSGIFYTTHMQTERRCPLSYISSGTMCPRPVSQWSETRSPVRNMLQTIRFQIRSETKNAAEAFPPAASICPISTNPHPPLHRVMLIYADNMPDHALSAQKSPT